MNRLTRGRVCLVLSLLSVGVVAAESVVVASSFPKEVLVAYKKAFDERHPQYRVEFVNFPGTHIMSYLADHPAGSRPDVFWSSSADSSRALLRHGLLQPIGGQGKIPAKNRQYRYRRRAGLLSRPGSFRLGRDVEYALSGRRERSPRRQPGATSSAPSILATS